MVNAIHVWGIARAFGGSVTVRIEDHDRTRSKPQFEQSILDDLEWLGLEADDDSTTSLRCGPSPYRQSDNADRYEDALRQLEQQGLVFPCKCTRREIAERAAHNENRETPYPGTCRDSAVSLTETPARRLRMEPAVVPFDDLLFGYLVQEPAQQCGDLLLRDRHGNWTYQFAVVVDDMTHGVDVVIRGEDLLESTGRQIHLARLLGRTTPPQFIHHVLVRHPDGSKLSKSNRDTGIRELRRQGATPRQLLGRAAYFAGLADADRPLDLNDIAELFAAR